VQIEFFRSRAARRGRIVTILYAPTSTSRPLETELRKAGVRYSSHRGQRFFGPRARSKIFATTRKCFSLRTRHQPVRIAQKCPRRFERYGTMKRLARRGIHEASRPSSGEKKPLVFWGDGTFKAKHLARASKVCGIWERQACATSNRGSNLQILGGHNFSTRPAI